MPTNRTISISARIPVFPRQRAMPRRLMGIPPTVQLIRQIEAQGGPVRITHEHTLGYQVTCQYDGNRLTARLNAEGEPLPGNDRSIIFDALRATNPATAKGRYTTFRGILNSWLK